MWFNGLRRGKWRRGPPDQPKHDSSMKRENPDLVRGRGLEI
jgi:hypothetical protein